MINQDELFNQIAAEESALMEEWEAKMAPFHDFSDWLDEDVTRCEKCGANVLWSREYPTCEAYTLYNEARNRNLREASGYKKYESMPK